MKLITGKKNTLKQKINQQQKKKKMLKIINSNNNKYQFQNLI